MAYYPRMFTPTDILESVVPTPADVEMAQKTVPRLAKSRKQGLNLRMDGKGGLQRIHLSETVGRLVLRLLEQVAEGNSIALVPVQKELSSAQAAQVLGVSRPFIVGQMKSGHLPFRKVGSHHRVRVEDLLRYKRKMDAARSKALDELTAEAQKLGLGY